jgi:hypothetical protein
VMVGTARDRMPPRTKAGRHLKEAVRHRRASRIMKDRPFQRPETSKRKGGANGVDPGRCCSGR